METNNDQLLKDFFGQHKKEIDDFGFSRRVIQQLPVQRNYSWIVWGFAVLGWAITLLLGFSTGVIQGALSWLQHLPQIYIPIAVFSFAVVACVVVLINQRKIYRVI